VITRKGDGAARKSASKADEKPARAATVRKRSDVIGSSILQLL
jgi:hypothetical protein